jgi:transcriptional regulator of acetoin/glycerol metabolism
VIRCADLPAELRGEAPLEVQSDPAASPERQALLDALTRHRWKPGPAAESLGISRATLYRRVHQHGIEMPGKRRS